MSLMLMPPPVATLKPPAAIPHAHPFVDEKTRAFETRIRQTGYQEMRGIKVRLRDGLVTLRGNVTSYYMKQVAQEAIRPLAIGLHINNEIEVRLRVNREFNQSQ